MHSHGCKHRLWADDARFMYIFSQTSPPTSRLLRPTAYSTSALETSQTSPPQLVQNELVISFPLSQQPTQVLPTLLKASPIYLNAGARHLGALQDNFLSLGLYG